METYDIYKKSFHEVVVTKGDNTGLSQDDFITSMEGVSYGLVVSAWIRMKYPDIGVSSVHAFAPNELGQSVVDYSFYEIYCRSGH